MRGRDNMQKEQQTELIFGRNAVLEALRADTPINHILVTSMTGSLGAICTEAKKRGIVVKMTDSRRLDQLTDGGRCMHDLCDGL